MDKAIPEKKEFFCSDLRKAPCAEQTTDYFAFQNGQLEQ